MPIQPSQPPERKPSGSKWLPQLPRIPHIPRREPIVSFAPSYLRMRLVVDVHIEIVAERETETIGENVVVSGNKTRQNGFSGPRRPSIVGSPVVNIPVRLISLVHPCNADIPSDSCCKSRECMVNALRCKRHILSRTPRGTLIR